MPPRIICARPSDQPISRRAVHSRVAFTAFRGAFLGYFPLCSPAIAGLVQFPVQDLQNTYVLIRAGQSHAEAEGYAFTSPVAKTSMSNALSPAGKLQVVQRTIPSLRSLHACDNGCWLWPAMATNAYQTAEMVAEYFGIGRNRIVPEFSKLDARGVGALDRQSLKYVESEMRLGDESGVDWRPPRSDTGVPNESIQDVMIRGRELLSLLETQFTGETVVLVSPDADNLAILQAAVAGVDLRSHHQFHLAPGDVRVLELSSKPNEDDVSISLPCPRPPKCQSALVH